LQIELVREEERRLPSDRRLAAAFLMMRLSAMTTKLLQRFYDLNGVSLTVEGDPEQNGFLEPVLGPLASTCPKPHGWVIALEPADEVQRPPPGSRILWEGPLAEKLESVLSEHDNNRTLLVPRHYNMTIDIESRSSLIRFTPKGRDSIGGTGVFWLLSEILAAENRFLLHAACLIEPQSDEAFLIFAPSGTGKTTTALTLAGNGLALAGDDALVVEISGNGAYAWGIPRGVKVDQRTAAMLPWLDPALGKWDSEEQFISLHRLDDLIVRASPARRRCGAIIVLKKPNAVSHQIKPISKADAAIHILSDNLHRSPGGVDASGRAKFSAVAQLLANTATLSLSMGPNPDSFKPRMILDAIHSIPRSG
jgi:hypothetical protein